MDSMDSLGIYISVPFCRAKCSYCNFASGVFPAAYHERYVEQVLAQVRSARQFAAEIRAELPQMVDSIYLGGGTPSLLAPDLFRRLFCGLSAGFRLSPAAEVTVECAPGQIEDDGLAAMVECGFNRVSFGVQSFVDREAAVTGRLHNRETVLRDIDRVRGAGIRSVNADLIAGLPHQTAESWEESLHVLVESGVDHASVYMLEVDEDSRLGRELLGGGGRYHADAVASDEQVADFYSEAVKELDRHGFKQYEISNFARPGRKSIHNKKYWLRQPYLGFGLDAHSMLRQRDGRAVRFRTADQLEAYLQRPGWTDVRFISQSHALEEAWFLGLRLNEGVDLEAIEQEFGYVEAHAHDALLAELQDAGFLERRDTKARLTDRGRLVSNDVFEQFLGTTESDEAELLLVD